MRIQALLQLTLLALAVSVCAQDNAATSADASTATAMPEDRKTASYTIYSSLMPLGPTGGKGWPNKLWLVQDTTVEVIPANDPCKPTSPTSKHDLVDAMNPHFAVRASDDRAQDLAEILEDWDRHCHDRVRLDRDGWRTAVPVLVLNSKEQGEFERSQNSVNVNGEPEPYEGAPALYGFSMAFFNKAHDVALVHATYYCGPLCAGGTWFALALEDGIWKRLDWPSAGWLS